VHSFGGVSPVDGSPRIGYVKVQLRDVMSALGRLSSRELFAQPPVVESVSQGAFVLRPALADNYNLPCYVDVSRSEFCFLGMGGPKSALSEGTWARTPFARIFEDRLREPLASPMLRRTLVPVVGGETRIIDPAQVALLAAPQVCPPFPKARVDRFVDEVVARVLVGRVTTSPWGFSRAVQGDAMIQAVAMDKSAGRFAFQGKPKSAYVSYDADGACQPGDFLRDRVGGVFRDIGSWVNRQVWAASFKDEMRPASKVAEGKSRVIYFSEMDFFMVCRMFLSPILSLILASARALGIAVGASAHSADWVVLADHLRAVAPDGVVFDGDFKGFDITQAQSTLSVVSTVIYRLACLIGWVAFALRAVLYCLYCCVVRVTVFDGVVTLTWGGLASGSAPTTVFNCLVVIYYYWDSYQHLSEGRVVRGFWVEVRLIVFGDDHVMACCPEIREWYNPRTIGEYLRTRGVVLTDADKNAPVDYRPLASATFLKRGFRWDEEMGILCAPLALDSIVKSLTYCSKELEDPDMRHSMTLLNAEAELWAHGRGVYAEWLPRLESAMGELPPSARRAFRGFDHFLGLWRTRSLTTWDSGGQGPAW